MIRLSKTEKNILMIVYTDYLQDTRVRREAETLASLPEFSVTVLALKNGRHPSTYVVDKVQVVELKEAKYRGNSQLRYVLSYFKFTLLSLLTCTSFFIRRRVDIVHVHNMPNFLVFAGIVPRMFGKKVILDVHDTVPETYGAKFNAYTSKLFSALCLEERLACAFSNRIISVNHVQSSSLVKRGIPEKKITVSMNVPDPLRFNPEMVETQEKRKSNTFKLVYHGTIAKRLGIDLIIRAIAMLKNEIPDAEFQIWGKSGKDMDELIRLRSELKIQNKIVFREPVPIERLASELMDMDLGVIGNRKNIATELMLPVKLLEYVALKIPVIAPRLKGIEYYFSDNMVTYFEPENLESLKKGIIKLYRDKSLRRNQSERARSVLGKYGWNTHKMDLINLYRNLLKVE